MVVVEEVLVLVFFAFMVLFLTFPIHRACVRPTLDLLDGSAGARYFPLGFLISPILHFYHFPIF